MKIRELLVATTNQHKLKEMVAVLKDLPITLHTLREFPNADTPEETGATFQENARQKAFYYAGLTGMVTLAEDSGFEVEALDGEPGIYSARFLRPDATYPERFAEIYARLSAKHASRSKARYVCALTVATRVEILFETIGIVDGQIADAPQGSGGFGYDPIFYYPPYGKTFGEISPEDKLAVSHRGRAIRMLHAHLEREL